MKQMHLYPDTTHGTAIFAYIGVVSGVGVYASQMECLGDRMTVKRTGLVSDLLIVDGPHRQVPDQDS